MDANRLMSLVGIASVIAIGYAMSTDRRRINWRTVLVGFAIQFSIGVLFLFIPRTAEAFRFVSDKVAEFLALSSEGSQFVFGSLANTDQHGFIFFVGVVPTIIFFSAFISIMYYLGVIQVIVQFIARAMQHLMKTSGSETLSCSANIFVGQTEAPLLIRPFLSGMTNSELNAVMVGGFATIAGGVLAAYIGFGVPANHLIIASLMGAPGALAMGKLIVPETQVSETMGAKELPEIDVGDNILDAAAKGTKDGLYLSLNVIAMLIAFISLIAVIDWVLGGLDGWIDGGLLASGETKMVGDSQEYIGIVPGSLSTVFGTIFSPLAFLMGVPWSESAKVGDLIGQKVCVNEFVAYLNMTKMMNDGELSQRAITISTYALCGFANFASIGIQIGGISALAENRRSDLARLGLRAMFAGTLVSCLTASIAGLLVAN